MPNCVFSADKCFNGTGEGYHGNKSVTEKGYTCQAWNHTKPHFHLFSPSKFPELRGGHNFCRNPGGNKGRPWCYTTDEKILYDYCDIERCGKCTFLQNGFHLNLKRKRANRTRTEFLEF